ncbi:MAG: putative enoyl-CoA hydratase echA8 [Phycisphaerae bacterium]|nr:putative enoyl-CoA hydratase echA8 [Phycisphaerae bacterium]
MSELIISSIDQHVGMIKLHRPEVLNALNLELMRQLVEQLEAFEQDENIYVMLLTGSDKVWAAGADINDMASTTMVEMYNRNQFARWERIKKISKPIVAAVNGYALGGGCELMMHCDIIVAAENARIGQPEINIGVMPGAGGTQRLTRAVGKATAMDVVLSGRFLTAREALEYGLVSRVVPAENCYSEALRIAHELCTKSPIALRLAKDAVLKAHEMSLTDGLEYERKLFYMLFATHDQKEGMAAFLQKRPPVYNGT